ncbi:TetR family transcriptional regulator [Plantibacter flavus]|uniref:ScbR family autoregulator-binding transcription factor n=1 Tax=Plantibacter flavus TaxID=150123 RepID=UPI0010C1BAE5|nr:ScbR family autoregulator-binding transcription factor [Plantibacter flavus]TKJ95538.1 TetR family transcriptional regulator [Plantibacter flavus]
MPATRRTPTQERGQVTQKAVVEGAAEVFDRIGFGNASLSMIAEASGISQGSMYFHFKSKEQIALAVIHEQHARSLPVMARVSEQYVGALERLIRASRAIVDQLETDAVVRAGIRLALDEGSLSAPAGSFYEDWIAGTAFELETALEAGELVSSMSAADLARTLIGFFTGVQLTAQATIGRSEVAVSVNRMWIFTIDAIVPEEYRAAANRIREHAFSGL